VYRPDGYRYDWTTVGLHGTTYLTDVTERAVIARASNTIEYTVTVTDVNECKVNQTVLVEPGHFQCFDGVTSSRIVDQNQDHTLNSGELDFWLAHADAGICTPGYTPYIDRSGDYQLGYSCMRCPGNWASGADDCSVALPAHLDQSIFLARHQAAREGECDNLCYGGGGYTSVTLEYLGPSLSDLTVYQHPGSGAASLVSMQNLTTGDIFTVTPLSPDIALQSPTYIHRFPVPRDAGESSALFPTHCEDEPFLPLFGPSELGMDGLWYRITGVEVDQGDCDWTPPPTAVPTERGMGRGRGKGKGKRASKWANAMGTYGQEEEEEESDPLVIHLAEM